jgi:hypothetical protein
MMIARAFRRLGLASMAAAGMTLLAMGLSGVASLNGRLELAAAQQEPTRAGYLTIDHHRGDCRAAPRAPADPRSF